MSLKGFSLVSFAFSFLFLVFSLNFFVESTVPENLLFVSLVFGVTFGMMSIFSLLVGTKMECQQSHCSKKFESLTREFDARYIKRRHS